MSNPFSNIYVVSLTAEEREYLEKLTTIGKTAAYKINHARVLLKADTNQDGGGSLDQKKSVCKFLTKYSVSLLIGNNLCLVFK
ncbi:hypothetical protein [Nostoc sp. ChiQUE01b]|uniref:hypothetical protein n=1 Tax=Nostoc sp. ChiQUE01b TaxID=3075376 RepID=UPI003A102969